QGHQSSLKKEDNLHHLQQLRFLQQQPVLLLQLFQMLLHQPLFQFQILHLRQVLLSIQWL
ncbi:hypothetical protein HN873_043413, partial [Arachis hypogaea]